MKTASARRRETGIYRNHVAPLHELESARGAGAKAQTLRRIAELDIRVPPGFVILDGAFQNFLDENNLRQPIAAACRDLNPKLPDQLRCASRQIRELIQNAKVSPLLGAEIAGLSAEMALGPVLIVRSSALGEDAADASFAGQLDSYPNVRSDREIDAALLSCWASYWSERALFYQLARGVRLNGMGVIVQKMIQPALAGVLFTLHPDTAQENTDRILVEYCYGHAEALVSGAINPGRLTISRSDFSWYKLSVPEQPADLKAERLLSRCGALDRLARLGLQLEREFGAPQDIEWVIDGTGELFLVQSRHITTRGESIGNAVDETNSADDGSCARAVVWSNANVNENFPEPITPLLYSIAAAGYYYYFRNLAAAFGISRRRIHAMEHQLRNIIGVHGCRMYYNLTNIHAALSMAPFADRLVDDFNDFVGAKEKTGRSRNQPGKWRENCRQAVEAGVMVFKTAWQYLFLTRRVQEFERTVSEFAERTEPARLCERSLCELGDDLRGFLAIRFHRWTHASLADAASMVCYGALKRFIGREFPSADEASLHNSLLKGLRDIVSSVPALKIWHLSRKVRGSPALRAFIQNTRSDELRDGLRAGAEFSEFQRELDEFLVNWGFRCSGELMLTVPSFQENPKPLFDILKSYVEMDDRSPEDVIRLQNVERESEVNRVLGALKNKRLLPFVPFLSVARIVALLLRWTHRSIALRERARLKQALLYNRCRRIALAMGEKLLSAEFLERRDDVFFLTYQELDQLVSGSAMFPYHVAAMIAQRKKEHAELSAMTPPDSMTLAEGGYLARAGANSENSPESPPAAKELRGTSACGGQAVSRATFLHDITESRLLNPGDVLVARQTDPGWGPVFFMIRGLVLERGGMLSHGAIIAREFGIPAVVGVANATLRLAQGQRVSVDGDRGVVTILD